MIRLPDLKAALLLRGEDSPVALAGLLTVVLAGLLVLTPSAWGRPAAQGRPPAVLSPAPAKSAAPEVADVLARAKALKDLGRINDALQVLEDALQLPDAPHLVTSPDLHWIQAWLLVSLSAKTGRNDCLVDAAVEFHSVVLLAGARSELGREAQRALDRIGRRE